MYFAQIDSNNIVINIIIATQEFINLQPGTWIQFDINGISPKNYAGIGFTWRVDLNGFIPLQPYPSWSLNNSTCLYDPPIAYPNDGLKHIWCETNQKWSDLGSCNC
jgi:hypothetical protein